VEGERRLSVGVQFRCFALALALSTVVAAARADVVVTGTLDHLRIEAGRAPILVVLEALKKQFGIAYRYQGRLDWTVDGTFTGSLSSIWPRLFRDKDYIVRIEPDRSLTVFLASPQGPPSAAAPMQPPVQASGPNPAPGKQARRRTDPPDGQVPDPPDKDPQ
jgi:hypothetical protein